MIVAIDEQRTVPMPLTEGKIVNRQHARDAALREGDLAGKPQERGRTGGHRLALALTRPSFTAERKCQVLQGGG